MNIRKGTLMGKVIFLNIDGTIRDFDGTIPVSGVEAIKKARQNGHEVVLNTGRAYFRIGKEILDIEFDGVVAGSGGYVEYKGERIGYRYFTQLAYIEFMRDLMEYGCVVEMESNKRSYILESDWEAYRRISREFWRYLHIREDEITMPVRVKTLLDVPEVQKLVIFSDKLSRHDIVSKWGYSFHVAGLGIPCNGKWVGEVTPNYITKAEGAYQILKAREIKKKDMIAIGCSEKDVSLLAFAGFGIAMGNGTKEAKIAARHVTASIKEDGLQKAFHFVGLL